MKFLFLALLVGPYLLMNTAQAKESCDKALDAIPQFESSKKMFNELFEFKKKYSHCMDGGIAEGVAGVIVDSLDKNWDQISDLRKFNKKDRSFKKFILTSIEPNVTGQEVEVNNIIAHAKKACPKNMKEFCKDLIKACERSLKPEQ
jgi:hypothetical protein